jgi:hypothetical protein
MKHGKHKAVKQVSVNMPMMHDDEEMKRKMKKEMEEEERKLRKGKK